MIKNKIWYAIQVGSDDNDWGTGTYDEADAERMARLMAENNKSGKMIRIAVIDQGPDGNADPICIDERIICDGE